MIIIGSDHAGYPTKEYIKKFLDNNKISYRDLTPQKTEGDDYPGIARKVAKEVTKDPKNRGILVCGTGTGMAMAANKVKGARAAMAYDEYSAIKSREDNNANIITLRGRHFDKKIAKNLVSLWLNTRFSRKARHKRRVDKIK